MFHSKDQKAHIHFSSKIAETFDLLGFSRQKADYPPRFAVSALTSPLGSSIADSYRMESFSLLSLRLFDSGQRKFCSHYIRQNNCVSKFKLRLRLFSLRGHMFPHDLCKGIDRYTSHVSPDTLPPEAPPNLLLSW